MNCSKDCYGKRGLVISADLADQFGIKENRIVKYLPPRECLSSIVRCKMPTTSSLAMSSEAIDFLRKQGLTAIDNAFGIWIVSLKEQVSAKYYKIWIPISASMEK